MQGRLVKSEKKNFVQYFHGKTGKKNFVLQRKQN